MPWSYHVPSVRISPQLIITASFFPLSVHFLSVASTCPPAVCTHTLPSQPLNRRQVQTDWHNALSTDTALLNSALTSGVCAFTERCLHVSSAVCTHPRPSQPLNRCQPSRSEPHAPSMPLSVSFLKVVCALPERCLYAAS